MDLGSAVRVLMRRWVVLVVGLVLTVGVAAYFYTQSRPRYQATANLILLLQPNARGTEGAGSPFLYLPNGLQVLAGIVVTGPDSREFRQDVASQGYVSQFEIGVLVGSPIMTVSVEGHDPGNVIATRDKVIEGLQVELATVQRDERTPVRQTAHTRVYANEAAPTPIQGNRTRGVLTVLGVGALLTLIAAFILDRGLLMLGDWRRRRGASAPSEPADNATAETVFWDQEGDAQADGDWDIDGITSVTGSSDHDASDLRPDDDIAASDNGKSPSAPPRAESRAHVTADVGSASDERDPELADNRRS